LLLTYVKGIHSYAKVTNLNKVSFLVTEPSICWHCFKCHYCCCVSIFVCLRWWPFILT